MYLGIDFGTSGCRACLIDDHEGIVYETHHALPAPVQTHHAIIQDPELWWDALICLFHDIQHNAPVQGITDICINGTSATLVHCSATGQVFGSALMYNDTSSQIHINTIAKVAPPEHVTLSASSALSKMMQFYEQQYEPGSIMLNQADWLSNRLCGCFGFSDYNNALKMGYDIQQNCWPNWIKHLLPSNVLPDVYAPGFILGQLNKTLSSQFGFKKNVNIKLGTTDSIAAFIATRVKSNTVGVTSLGSTLVLKILSEQPVNQADYGIYSHKLGQYWLAGGASNTGGKVLSRFFSNDELVDLSQSINPHTPSLVDYYPLPDVGERFPLNDPFKQPRITPRPDNDADFLKGLFAGIAHIEQLGYQRLASLGTKYPETIMSCGGGSVNVIWQQMRQNIIGANIQMAAHSQAAYGSALLAKNGINDYL